MRLNPLPSHLQSVKEKIMGYEDILFVGMAGAIGFAIGLGLGFFITYRELSDIQAQLNDIEEYLEDICSKS